MQRILPAADFFSTPNPAVLGLPHLVTALDAELIGKVAQLTKANLGIWNVPAPYDAEDRFDNLRENIPVSTWALPLNQREILAFSPFVQEAVFGTKLMLLDAAADQALLTRLAVSPGRRLDSGAWVMRGFQDLPELLELIEHCAWALIPIGAERGLGLFVVHSSRGDRIAQLTEWCEHNGRNHGQFRQENGLLVLVDQFAPEKYRANTLGHQVDAFLSRVELYLGESDAGIKAAIDQRLHRRRQLQEEIMRARTKPPAGQGSAPK